MSITAIAPERIAPPVNSIVDTGSPVSLIIQACEALLAEGQYLLLYDRAWKALADYPGNVRLTQLAAVALLRTGAVVDGKVLLESICPPVPLDTVTVAPSDGDKKLLYQAYRALRDVVSRVPYDAKVDVPELTPADYSDLRQIFAALPIGFTHRQPLRPVRPEDEETLGLLGSAYKRLWDQSGDMQFAQRSCALYLYGFRQFNGIWCGINAATMSFVTGEREEALKLAAEVIALCEATTTPGLPDDFYTAATLAEAHLLRGESEAATETLSAAGTVIDFSQHRGKTIATLAQLELLERHGGIAVPASMFQMLRPPAVAVAVGHESYGRAGVARACAT